MNRYAVGGLGNDFLKTYQAHAKDWTALPRRIRGGIYLTLPPPSSPRENTEPVIGVRQQGGGKPEMPSQRARAQYPTATARAGRRGDRMIRQELASTGKGHFGRY